MCSKVEYYTFKEYRLNGDIHDMVGMAFLHPVLHLIHGQIILYCMMNNLPYDITRTLGKGIPGVSVSRTHADGRAIDLSVKGFRKEDVDRMVDYFNDAWKVMGAVSYSDQRPRVMVYHKGTGWHIHVQVRRDILTMSNEEILKLLRRVKWIGNKNLLPN